MPSQVPDRENVGSDAPPSEPTAAIAVTVARTGGIAGIRREWERTAPPADPTVLIDLVRACPWDQPIAETPGADRFVWHIHVVSTSREREQRVPEAALTGPWRALVEAVRDDLQVLPHNDDAHPLADPRSTPPESPDRHDPDPRSGTRSDITITEDPGRTAGGVPDEGN